MFPEHSIKLAGLPLRKFSSFLRPVKDELRLGTPGVYSIPYEWGQVSNGQTGRSIETRTEEHYQHIPLGQWQNVGSTITI